MILDKIGEKGGFQPQLRALLADIAVIEKDTPQYAEAPTDTETVAANDYTITAPLGIEYNGYQFTLLSSGDADDEVAIEETAEEEYNITAGNNAVANDVETALEAKFGGDWTATAGNAQEGSDFDGEILTLEGGQFATTANEGELLFDGDNLYIAADDIERLTETGWKEVSLSDVT